MEGAGYQNKQKATNRMKGRFCKTLNKTGVKQSDKCERRQETRKEDKYKY